MSRSLSRARTEAVSGSDPEQFALALFGIASADKQVPVAPFRYLADFGQAPARYCLNADPVHLRADARGLLLFDAQSLAITDEEAAQLSSTLQTGLNADGWTLQVGAADRWYLLGPAIEDLRTTPLATVLGQAVGRFLPRGRSAAEWLNRSNEWQMLLHNHPVNRQRAARAEPAVNSIWLWGGGTLAPANQRRYEQVYSEQPLLHGLARWSGAGAHDLPADATGVLQAQHSGPVLVNLDGCRRAAACEDLQQWNSAVQRYERDWFAPLLDALARGAIRRLELLPLNGKRYRLGRFDAWRLWRRTRNYRSLLCKTQHSRAV